ncbi:fungal-specific transcription factor domain-containing protein [Parachaetomium inaequale]|uniref:Fungal-specific transcription factor domain-containing protein n=1 Tax=Parachaetomium inaequale TaxID=2588326 RepID=A0AAN6PB25_9PEZI|nr:fungal-specific transcription factor domain-containing protein [Parachaetomium inaequale]
MDSDDAQSVAMPSPWLDSLATGSTSVSVSSSSVGFAHTGQLSPISNGVDLPCGAARSSATLASPSQSPPVTAESHAASSSVRAPAWPPGYTSSGPISALPRVPEGYGAHHHPDASWEEEEEDDDDDMLTVPKLEPLEEDDFCMNDLQEAPSPPTLSLSSHPQGALDQPKPKRPRGRPRKHPLIPSVATNKITKGRSKTGCLTCRKRKKKCDEAKPRCMNCEKNAVVCEGYPEKQIWKSGRERAEEERLKCRRFPSITMRPLFHGLETAEDRIFWKHYNEHLSAVLTVEGEHKNAFKDMMIPIAVKHQGLMHSILSLASKHLDFDTPYGANVLRNNPNTSLEALKQRSLYHHDQAVLRFYHDVEFTNGTPNTNDKTLVAARYGQMLCFLLATLVEGSPRGEHRLHLTAYRNLISTSPPEDSTFLSFIAEVFQYYIFADELIHSAVNQDAGSPVKPLPPIPAMHQPRLLGVADGLLGYLSQITAIRNTIRGKMMAQMDPVVDYEDLYSATDIDGALQEWTPHWPPGDSRDQVSLLYKQMMWIYLDRTVYLPSPSAPPSSMASSAASLPFIHSAPSHGRPPPSVVNTPPQSASTSCASSPKFVGSSHGPNLKTSRPSSRLDPSSRPRGSNLDAGETAAAGGSRAESPPPARQPPHLNPRVTLAVNESLALLESFKPSDPCQTLLLLPCFLVGTACFNPTQQKRVRAAIRTVRGYTGLRNADRAVEVLEEVWRLMQAGDWVAAWDWPGVADRLGLDFIPA